MRTIRIYLAGPYTKPDPCANTHAAIRMADAVADRGYVPFVPHLTHLWHTVSPKPYPFWLDQDMHWLRVCDVVLRFGGESSGADAEVAEAKRLGIPVVCSLDELEEFRRVLLDRE